MLKSESRAKEEQEPRKERKGKATKQARVFPRMIANGRESKAIAIGIERRRLE
jgi:hypothetical protein